MIARYILVLLVFISSTVYSLNTARYKLIRKKLDSLGVLHSEIVTAQCVQETGWLKSKAFKNKHNLFGFMRNGKTMKFKSDLDCLVYYARWQKKWYKPSKWPNYYSFLNKVYHSDKEYTKKLKSIIKRLK